MPNNGNDEKIKKNSDAKLKANNRYTAKNYEEVKFRVPKGEKTKLKQYAQEHHYSVNALIYDALLHYCRFLDESVSHQTEPTSPAELLPVSEPQYHIPDHPDGYKVVSLFSGMGSICLAFAQAGFKIVKSFDEDHDACELVRSYFGKDIAVEDDILRIDYKDYPHADVLVVGFPNIVPIDGLVIEDAAQYYDDLLRRVLDIAQAIKPRVIYMEFDDLDPIDFNNRYLSEEEIKTRMILESFKEESFRFLDDFFKASAYYLFDYSVKANEFSELSQSGTKKYFIAVNEISNLLAFNLSEPIQSKAVPAVDQIRRDQKQDDFFYYHNNISFERFVINTIKSDHMLYKVHMSKIYNCIDGMCPALNSYMVNKRNTVALLDDYGVRQLTPKEYLMFKGYPNGIDFPKDMRIEKRYQLAGGSATIPITKQFAKKIKEHLDSI